MGWIADLLKEIPSAARYKSELETMEKENAQLKTKVGSLEASNAELRQEIQRRDEVIKKQESHGSRLEKIKEKILLQPRKLTTLLAPLALQLLLRLLQPRKPTHFLAETRAAFGAAK